MRPTLLILEDDPLFARAAMEIGKQNGYDVHHAPTIERAKQLVARSRMDLMLVDLELPDGSGLSFIDDIDFGVHGQAMLVTAKPTIESAARAVGGPVARYLVKPIEPEQLSTMLHDNRQRIVADPTDASGHELQGQSSVMRDLRAAIARIAPLQASVLITGETGTGKELIARAVHERSGCTGRFVAINCGAIAAELLASELFGHERGSFTGAHARHLGVLEQAAHGTLLLDEIGEMPLALQVYLLRVLESGHLTRVGGTQSIPVPVRIIAATNRDPVEAIHAGTLREDLYYRLAQIPLHAPPLRARGDDVLLLAKLFIQRLNERHEQGKYLHAGCERNLLRHRWPGNVRELANTVQRAYFLQSGNGIHVTPDALRKPPQWEDEQSIHFSVGTSLADVERHTLLKTLAYYDNDKTAAAEALGISVRTIYNQLARATRRDAAAGIEG